MVAAAVVGIGGGGLTRCYYSLFYYLSYVKLTCIVLHGDVLMHTILNRYFLLVHQRFRALSPYHILFHFLHKSIFIVQLFNNVFACF